MQLVSLVLDVSDSMGKAANPKHRPPIEDLRDTLACFHSDLLAIRDCLVEVSIVSFAGETQIECPFEAVSSLTLPRLVLRKTGTNLGGALHQALDELLARREYLRSTGMEVQQPFLVCITDGQPNANTAPGFEERLVNMINKRSLIFLPLALGGSESYDALEAISPREKPVRIGPDDAAKQTFRAFFKWISQSIDAGELLDRSSLEA